MITSHKEWIREIFSKAAPNYGQHHNAFFNHFARGLVQLADLQPGQHVLDVATGRGAVLKQAQLFLGSNSRVVGVDLSSEMIQQLSVELPETELHVMDAESLGFPDESFDVVFCGFGVFFFPNIELALQEFFRVLKPGGKLLFSTWQSDNGLLQAIAKEELSAYSSAKTNLHSFHDPVYIQKLLPDVKIHEDRLDHIYPTLEAWFQSLWFQGARGLLEKLTPSQLEDLKKKLFERLAPELKSDGLHNVFQSYYIEARKPF